MKLSVVATQIQHFVVVRPNPLLRRPTLSRGRRLFPNPIREELPVNRPRQSGRLHHRLANWGGTNDRWLDAREQCQFTPFPVAVDIDEANFAQPRQLSFKIEQLVRWIFIRPGDCLEEPGVETGSWRSDVLKITECAARSEKLKNLLVQCTFSFV